MAFPVIFNPLQPSPRALRIDNTLVSKTFEEPLRSVDVMNPYNLRHDSFKTTQEKSARSLSGYRTQLENLAPRYRTTPLDGRLVADTKSPTVASPPPRYRVPLFNSDLFPPSPSFLSNAGQNSSFPGLYLYNQQLPAKPLRNVYDSQLFWLGLYFAFNLGLTLFNKGVLLRFPFPYTLTALHALCGSIGRHILLENGVFKRARLGTKETAGLVAFSVLYAINIVVSNISLHLVTVPVREYIYIETI